MDPFDHRNLTVDQSHPAPAHNHLAGDINGGQLTIDRLVSNPEDADGLHFVADDLTLKVPAGSGGGAAVADNYPYVVGWVYDNGRGIPHAAWSSTAIQANRLYFTPFKIEETITISSYGVEVVTGLASAQLHLALIDLGADRLPGAKLDGTSSPIDASTSGAKERTGLTLQLTPGWKGVAFVSAHTIAIRNTGQIYLSPFGHSTTTDTTLYGVLYRAMSFGVIPDPWGASPLRATGLFKAQLTVASVP